MLYWVNKILLVLSLVVSTITLVIFILWFTYEKPSPLDIVEKEALLKSKPLEKLSDTFEIKKLVVNLPSRLGRLKFLEAGIHFVPFKNNDLKVLEEHEFILRDTVIDAAGKMEEDELNSISGKILLEERILSKLNTIFKRNIIKELYFSGFLIQ